MRQHRGAQVAQAVARALAEAMAQRRLSANALAQQTGVNRQVISNILTGASWPDLLTIATIEQALGVLLWPNHVAWPAEGDPATMPAQAGAPSESPHAARTD